MFHLLKRLPGVTTTAGSEVNPCRLLGGSVNNSDVFLCESDEGVLFSRGRRILWYDRTCTRLTRVFTVEKSPVSACFVTFGHNNPGDVSVAVQIGANHIRIYACHSNTVDCPVPFAIRRLWSTSNCLLLERSFSDNEGFEPFTAEVDHTVFALFDPLGSVIPVPMFDSPHRWNTHLSSSFFSQPNASPSVMAMGAGQFSGEKLQDSAFGASATHQIIATRGNLLVVRNITNDLIYLFAFLWRHRQQPQLPATTSHFSSPAANRSPTVLSSIPGRESPLMFTRDRTSSGTVMPQHDVFQSSGHSVGLRSIYSSAVRLSPSPSSSPVQHAVPMLTGLKHSVNRSSSPSLGGFGSQSGCEPRLPSLLRIEGAESPMAAKQSNVDLENLPAHVDCGLYKLCEIDDFAEVDGDSSIAVGSFLGDENLRASFSPSYGCDGHFLLHVILVSTGKYQVYEIDVSSAELHTRDFCLGRSVDDPVRCSVKKLAVHKDVCSSVSSVCHLALPIGSQQCCSVLLDSLESLTAYTTLLLMQNGRLVIVVGSTPVCTVPFCFKDDCAIETEGVYTDALEHCGNLDNGNNATAGVQLHCLCSEGGQFLLSGQKQVTFVAVNAWTLRYVLNSLWCFVLTILTC
jgi:hypothetical protein